MLCLLWFLPGDLLMKLVLNGILHCSLTYNRVFTHQLEVKFGNSYWDVMTLTALLMKESKYDSVEGTFSLLKHWNDVSCYCLLL